MNPTGEGPSWERVDTLFTRALELDPEARSAYLGTAVAGNAELRQSVEKLLVIDAEAEASGFLGRSAAVTWQSLWKEAVRDLPEEERDPPLSTRRR